MNRFKRIAVVINPTAKNGNAAVAGERVERFLARTLGSDSYALFHTEYPQHATELVAQLHPSYGTVITVGGDGLVHEVANGLMRIDEVNRPVLAVVPLGSGNDYAETLGMTRARTVEDALTRILDYHVVPMDIGCVNGEYFVQTLSFGVDAAIALDTVERRRRTGRTGTLLYLESGIDQMLHHLDELHYEAYLAGVPSVAGGLSETLRGGGASSAAAGGAVATNMLSTSGVAVATNTSLTSGSTWPPAHEVHLKGSSYIFAVQIGPTYGGHFRVCPQADPSDGLFDICLAHPPLNALSATFLFLMAKGGHHTHFRRITFHRAQSLMVRFDAEPPAQADGEKLHGTTFQITTIPQALRVVRGVKP